MSADQGISHYDVLGISADASEDDLKTAYRQLAKSLHPDRNEYGANLMKQINLAYAVLSDSRKRCHYDQSRRAAPVSPNREDEDEPANKKRKIDPEHYICLLCREIVTKKFWEASCCASLFCVECFEEKKRHVCPNISCQEPVKTSHAGNNPLEWASSSKFIQKQIDSFAPTHICGRNVLPENLTKHKRVCPKLNTKCFKCLGKGKFTTIHKIETQCNSCNGMKFLQGLDWVKCYMCMGYGIFVCSRGNKVNCVSCNSSGAHKGIWSKCFPCEGSGALGPTENRVVCSNCNNKGVVAGVWTRCFKCKGKGRSAHCPCDGKGALKGKWTICFKCDGNGWVTTNKGARNKCDGCSATGKVSGFNLQPCTPCNGYGCTKCEWRGSEPCNCGLLCKGHPICGRS